ncbi:hypothetical protein L207DRAFT_577655 [Hyaloscypha variabilis F]|uniref:MYND-type domain-containing protein n=1 Tax=Hyaloscypha variabilis (strain UAMH 11265 / GT02V1 / F) TaxID=1149755 RepID=A0A2J6S7R7_HYAVF|nr:hypothetical protein L207DRAFT_577655 [Hyaloscypha variabilis F]
MEIQIPTPTHRCFRCNKLATSCCAGCKDAPSPIRIDTYYCSRDCQRASWRNGHKEICQLLHTTRTLYRAGAFLQEIFYKYRERVFDRNIVKVEAKNGKLYLHEKDFENKSAELLSHSDFVFPFPDHFVDSLAWMHEAIKYLLKDLVSEITEVEVIPKNHKREVIAIDDDCVTGQGVGSHSIIKLTLEYGGESYALDLTGAQYGYYDPINPWPDYLNTRVLSFQSNKPPQCFGQLKEWHLCEVRERNKDMVWAVMHLNSVASKTIMGTILAWEEGQKVTVQEMLRQPLQTYLALQEELIGSIAKTLEDFMQDARP